MSTKAGRSPIPEVIGAFKFLSSRVDARLDVVDPYVRALVEIMRGMETSVLGVIVQEEARCCCFVSG